MKYLVVSLAIVIVAWLLVNPVLLLVVLGAFFISAGIAQLVVLHIRPVRSEGETDE